MRTWLAITLLLILLAAPVLAEQSWCGPQVLYFQHNLSVSPAGYEELINRPSGNQEVIETVTVRNTGGPILIDNYIAPPNTLTQTGSLLAGLRKFHTYAYVDTASGTTRLNFTKFIRFANGDEKNLYTVMSDDIDSPTPIDYETYFVAPYDFPLNATDRIGIRVTANTSHSSNVALSWVYQGTAHASWFDSGFFVCDDSTTSSGLTTCCSAEETPISPAVPVLAAIGAIIIIAWRNKK
jgi:hypothetical protein